MSFLFRKVEDVTTISKSVSHFGEHKRLHLESSKQNYHIISLRLIIKAVFTIRICVQSAYVYVYAKRRDEILD